MNRSLLTCMEKVGKADGHCCKLMITNLQRALIPTHRVFLAGRFCFSPETSLMHPALLWSLSLCQQAASPLFTQKLMPYLCAAKYLYLHTFPPDGKQKVPLFLIETEVFWIHPSLPSQEP